MAKDDRAQVRVDLKKYMMADSLEVSLGHDLEKAELGRVGDDMPINLT